jgi:hypothetical protein
MLVVSSGPTDGGSQDGRVSVQVGDGGGRTRQPADAGGRNPELGVGDRIYFGARTLQVIGRRDDDADQPPVLVVEDVAG